MIKLLEIVLGLASGVMIGAGFLAILIVLGVIQRLIRIAQASHLTNVFGAAAILGALCGTYFSFTSVPLMTVPVVLIILGLMQGIFNGMVAAALTEILNVFPMLAKRISMERYIYWLLVAVVFGKVGGSLFQWFFLVK